MRVQIEDVSLEVEVTGAGEPSLVFLHYWGGTRRTWRSVVGELDHCFRLVTYDMRGWGESGTSSLAIP